MAETPPHEQLAAVASLRQKVERGLGREAKGRHPYAGFFVPLSDAEEILAELVRLAGERDTPGVTLIAAERKRQTDAEGWTVEHDDSHDDGALAEAAAYIASLSPGRRVSMGGETLFYEKVVQWPWDNDVTEHSRIDGLAKAGALIAAEIDRLARLGVRS